MAAQLQKISIVGAGAIGGFIGTRLATRTRCVVSAYARGETLRALQTQGWRMHTEQGLERSAALGALASDSAHTLGVQDLVVIALKTHALGQVATQISALIGPHTTIVPAINGVPWWFLHEGLAGSELTETRLMSLDPQGALEQAWPVQQVLGCVVHASAATSAPGVVRHHMGQGLVVGEPAGGTSPRAQEVSALFAQAGFEVTLSHDIRRDIWYKLWGNLTINPISAVVGCTAEKILADPLVRAFCAAVMQEAAAIGVRIGCPIAQSAEERFAVTAKLGNFKTSMLQDVEAGRKVELDALVAVVHELGQKLGIATPNVDALLGVTRLFAKNRGFY